jgi:hypothetical protein
MTTSVLDSKNYEKFGMGRELPILDFEGKSTGKTKVLWEAGEYNRFLGKYVAFKSNEEQNLPLALKNLKLAVRALCSNFVKEWDSVPLSVEDLKVMIDTAADLSNEANRVKREYANGLSEECQRYLDAINNYLSMHIKVVTIDKYYLENEIEEAAKKKTGGDWITYLIVGGAIVGAILTGGLAGGIAIIYFGVKVSVGLAIGAGGAVAGGVLGAVIGRTVKTIQYQKQEEFKKLLRTQFKVHKGLDENSHIISDSSFFQKSKDLIEFELEPKSKSKQSSCFII